MSVLWGLFSCCGAGVALIALALGAFVVTDRVKEWRNWRRWRRQAPAALEDPRPPLPDVLRDGRKTREWRGGYLSRGHESLRARAQRLLRHGVVRQAKVLEAEYRSDADDWDGYVVYAFRRLDGSVAVERAVSSVNTWGAAVSQGSGPQALAFDIMDIARRAGWLHVLLDPQSGEHLIYESLLADEDDSLPGPSVSAQMPMPTETPTRAETQAPAPPRANTATPVARAARDEEFPPAPPNIHGVPLTSRFATLEPAGTIRGQTEEQVLREGLALFPTLPTSEDDGDRRVLADLLVERGYARGEFIALQTLASPTPAHRARIAELLRLHGAAWLPPGVDARRSEFRRGFAWAVTLQGGSDLHHHEWRFIRHVSVAGVGGPGLFDGFELLPLSSLTGVGPLALWYLLRNRPLYGLRHLELAMTPQELLQHAELLRAMTPMERLSLRTRRQALDTSVLASLLDALPTPQRVRLLLQWGDVRGFQREVARRPWLRALELVALESTASSLMVEITGETVRVITAGKHDAGAWNALSAALRAQGFTSVPLLVSETGAQREQRLA